MHCWLVTLFAWTVGIKCCFCLTVKSEFFWPFNQFCQFSFYMLGFFFFSSSQVFDERHSITGTKPSPYPRLIISVLMNGKQLETLFLCLPLYALQHNLVATLIIVSLINCSQASFRHKLYCQSTNTFICILSFFLLSILFITFILSRSRH